MIDLSIYTSSGKPNFEINIARDLEEAKGELALLIEDRSCRDLRLRALFDANSSSLSLENNIDYSFSKKLALGYQESHERLQQEWMYLTRDLGAFLGDSLIEKYKDRTPISWMIVDTTPTVLDFNFQYDFGINGFSRDMNHPVSPIQRVEDFFKGHLFLPATDQTARSFFKVFKTVERRLTIQK